MAANLFQNEDGACAASKAVKAYISCRDGVEPSWCSDQKEYLAVPKISRWENCREQGYVIWMRSKDYSRQINIAFYEHRNSDEICAIVWEQETLNAPAISTIKEDVFKDKWDVSHSVSYNKSYEMADWIMDRLEKFWIETNAEISGIEEVDA